MSDELGSGTVGSAGGRLGRAIEFAQPRGFAQTVADRVAIVDAPHEMARYHPPQALVCQQPPLTPPSTEGVDPALLGRARLAMPPLGRVGAARLIEVVQRVRRQRRVVIAEPEPLAVALFPLRLVAGSDFGALALVADREFEPVSAGSAQLLAVGVPSASFEQIGDDACAVWLERGPGFAVE